MTPSLRIDLHVHSAHSPDSTLSVGAIVAGLARAGLDGCALTDHNSVQGHPELDRLQARHPELRLVPGIELSAREGHLLVLGVRSLPPAPAMGVAELARWAEGAGGVAILAHPFRWVHGAGGRIAGSAPVHGLETLNGATVAGANRRAARLAARRSISATGGSDAHALADLGRAFTVFPEGVGTLEEILEALRHGRGAPAGRSLSTLDRVRNSLRNGWLRAARGFRPV